MPPLNLVGDFGGGGMFLAFGVVCALLEAQRSGQGQVVDAAMVDGTAVLMTMFWSLRGTSVSSTRPRPATTCSTPARHFYDVYECADGGTISIGSIEPQFYAELLERTGLGDDPAFAAQMDQAAWPALKEKVAALFRTRTRDEWCELLEMTDVCFAPVLTMTRGGGPPPQRRPRHVRRVRRRHAAGAGAALQPHGRGDRRRRRPRR